VIEVGAAAVVSVLWSGVKAEATRPRHPQAGKDNKNHAAAFRLTAKPLEKV
jgi:hypothetical protein